MKPGRGEALLGAEAAGGLRFARTSPFALPGPLRRRWTALTEPANAAALAFSFILVYMKKWEPGGNIDAIWYETIARNIARSGDFFHFYVSKNFPDVWDHMPLTYWVVGGLMRAFGVSDYVARLYPMACAFSSCLMVYAAGRRLRAADGAEASARFGLVALVSYALCLGAMKWNGSLMQDVPLTTWFLACYLTFLRAHKRPSWLLATGFFFGLGVLTKGPIVFAFAGAAAAWTLWTGRWRLWVSSTAALWAIAGAGVAAAVVGSLYLPFLHFNGRPYFELFYEAKKGYVAPSSGGWARHFAYLEVLWTGAFLVIPFAVRTAWRLAFPHPGSRLDVGSERFAPPGSVSARAQLGLVSLVIASVAVPLSFFAVKFPHYMLPVYPFLALLAAPSVAALLPPWWLPRLPSALTGASIAVAFFFVATPVKITGGRSKDELNLANALKFDDRLEGKDVAFVGGYQDNMIVLQTFKMYGGIDLAFRDLAWAAAADLKRTWLIIPNSSLPLARAEGPPLSEADCVFSTEKLCAASDRSDLRFSLPNDRFPHEVY